MKKFLFFAIAALALVFTACEKNGPVNPEDIDIKDYVGSMWYLDSINTGEFTTTHMCQPIFLLSETELRISNEVVPFKYDTTRLFIRETAYDIVSLDDKGIVLRRDGSTIYVSALPTLDRDKQKTISESALEGKYKQVISTMEQTPVEGPNILTFSNGGVISWVTLQSNHKMLFEDSGSNAPLDGFWALNIEDKLFAMATVGSYDELIAMDHWSDILVFNDDYLVIGEDYDYDPSMGFTHRHYESVWVRVK